ncbi:hypothetical protein BGZ97_009782 [Linnemannia gamsii]|uniref:WD40 repeat-like protein n=1 Tax=Linnemannia gamsii TaxID=64522 RepID=A0A9P6RB60_9FUNG|nr:hypothetical protein BGZ97_009782 [Linnemannia gamsii]
MTTSDLERARRKLFRLSITDQNRSIYNALAVIQLGPIGMFVPQGSKQASARAPPATVTVEEDEEDMEKLALERSEVAATLSVAPQRPWLEVFPQNIAAPALWTSLPTPGSRFESTAQLAYCSNLFRKPLSPPPAVNTLLHTSMDSTTTPQPTLVAPSILLEEEEIRTRWLSQRVVEKFVADGFKNSAALAEVLLLGPSLDQEYYRKLLNCLITEFEAAKLLDVNLLQGLIQLVESASPEHIEPDDLVRILAVFRNRLQDTHQQTTKHPYYITLALSRLLDVMVDGKVKDVRRVADHEPLSALLSQLKDSTDPYLKHQATYASQSLLHVPNDETHRQYVLRHAGNIAMGLLGVASVCKLDVKGFIGGAEKIYDAAVEALDIGGKMADGARSALESGQDLRASVKGGIMSGGRLLWYSALREAQEHIRNGRLQDFNHIIFEASCRDHVEFQWGICRLLGEIAMDQFWGDATRQLAVLFLAELYRSDSIRIPNEEIDVWILTILRQVVALPDTSIVALAQSLLQGLEWAGNGSRRNLYLHCLGSPLDFSPIKVRISIPATSKLLAHVLDIPDLEYDILRLKQQRLAERRKGVYIPPQAKPSLKATDDTLFPLMEKVEEFLDSHRQVFLVLGDSGAGKSTFNLELEHTLWRDYRKDEPIPLYINLPTIDNPAQDLIRKQLLRHNFSEDQIQEMKMQRQFVLICDGYDESQLMTNIHTTNQLNEPWQWKAKVVITCRTQYLGVDYCSRFQPQPINRYDQIPTDLFQEVVIASFSKSQIQQYVEQYVKSLSMRHTLQDKPSWTKEDYIDKLTHIPNLMDLVSNPFLLTLALEALPAVIDPTLDLASIRITRVQLYDSFVKQWITFNRARLERSALRDDERSEFDALVQDNFLYHGIRYQKDLAAAIFIEHAGNPVVQYTHLRDRNTWKANFFSPESQVKLLLESSTVMRTGPYFRFLHRSFLEYFYAMTIYDPADHTIDAAPSDRPPPMDLKDSLSRMNFIGEPSILEFLAERVEANLEFMTQLLDVIENSKTDAQLGQAAANSITILVRAGVRFNGEDLRGIRIPGADLRGGQFDSADLEGADLKGANLDKTWLRKANLRRAQMADIQFGELPFLEIGGPIGICAISSDGKYLAVSSSTPRWKVHIYDTAIWTRIASHFGGPALAFSRTRQELAMGTPNNAVVLCDALTGNVRLALTGLADPAICISYSADGTQVAAACGDKRVHVWSTSSGDTMCILQENIATAPEYAARRIVFGSISAAVFSPMDSEIMTCGEYATSLLWDSQTGKVLTAFEGQGATVSCLAYSPDGHQIATGGGDQCVRLWNVSSGKLCLLFRGHTSSISNVSFSPDGRQVSSCGKDGTIHIWNPVNGEQVSQLLGHYYGSTQAVYSPANDYIASAGVDWIVRLWSVGANTRSVFSRRYFDFGTSLCLDFSAAGDHILTSNGSSDGRMRLLDSLTGNSQDILTGCTKRVLNLALSPCSTMIASLHDDFKLRLWDTRTGDLLYVFEGHTQSLCGLAFSPTGLHRVVTGSADKTVRVWNTMTGGEPVLVLVGHDSMIRMVTYSPSGHQIAAATGDQTVCVWCSQTGVSLFVLDNFGGTSNLMYSPNGQHLISVIGAGLSCWDTQSGQRVDRFDAIDSELTAWTWKEDVNGSLYLLMLSGAFSLSVWNLAEIGDGVGGGIARYHIRLVWCMGPGELTLEGVRVEDAIGLSPSNLKLLEQRGAITSTK